jgi:hypothetical protein
VPVSTGFKDIPFPVAATTVYRALTIIGKDHGQTVRDARTDAAVRRISQRMAVPCVSARFIQ